MANSNYQLGQFGLGLGNYNQDTTNLLADQGLMEFAGNQGIDINSLNPQELQGLSESYKGLGYGLDAGKSLTGADSSFMGMNTGEWDNALKAGQLGLETGQLVSNVLGYFQQKPIYKEQLNQLKLQSKGLESDINNKLAAREAYKSFGNINNPTTKVVV